MVSITLRAATSITETSFETPLVVRRYFSSGVKAMCHTRWPTSRYFCTWWVAASTTAMRLAGPSATNAVLPSRVMSMPTGWIASPRMPGIANAIFVFPARLTGSMTLTVPPISDDTHSSEPSLLNCANRGRWSTSTLATTSCEPVSMKWAMLVVSEVLTRNFPSGLSPVLYRAEPGAPFDIDDRDGVVILVGDVENPARRVLDEELRIGARRQRVDDLVRLGVDHLDGVVVADRDQHVFLIFGQRDAARPLANFDGFDDLASGRVDDGNRVAFLVRHIGRVGGRLGRRPEGDATERNANP